QLPRREPLRAQRAGVRPARAQGPPQGARDRDAHAPARGRIRRVDPAAVPRPGTAPARARPPRGGRHDRGRDGGREPALWRDSRAARWGRGALAPPPRRSLASGRGVSLHASGDRAVRMALDALEGAGSTPGEIRLERVELVTPQDAARIRARKLTVVFMPFY